MGYIMGICGIVLGAAVLFAILYAFFIRRYDLDDVSLNSREDRKYGNVELDYDYDDDDRVEAFQDMVDFAKKIEDEEFDATVDEINKFVARRTNSGPVADEMVEVAQTPVQTQTVPQQVQVGVQQQVHTVQTPMVQQQVVAQPQIQPQIVQTQVIQPQVVAQPVQQPSLYEQINDDGPDDYVEEL